MKHSPYGRLAAMAALSFLFMYALMYSMVASFGDVYNSLNQAFMAALMTAPMVAIELALMSDMYPNKRRNGILLGGCALAGILCFAFIRRQTAIADGQFLRSMIPHHSGAILMCGQASLTDPRIVDLCRSIVAGQKSEIDQMKAIMASRDARR